MILLPTSTSKLLAQWQGPYQVVKRMGKVTYLIDMHDRRKRRRVFHVNMLREFRIHRATDSNYFTDCAEGGDDDEVPFWKDGAPDDPTY